MEKVTAERIGHEQRRFLQHVLPRGFHKVRYFGLWHPAHRHVPLWGPEARSSIAAIARAARRHFRRGVLSISPSSSAG